MTVWYEVPYPDGIARYHTQAEMSKTTDAVVLGIATRVLSKYRNPRTAYNALRSARTADNADAIQARVFKVLPTLGTGVLRANIPPGDVVINLSRGDGEEGR